MIKANDPTRISWVQYDGSTDFPVQNIPFGIMIAGGKHKVCSRIGDYIIDIAALYELGFLNGIDLGLQHLENEFLNDFISLGKEVTNAVRDRLADVLDDKNTLGAKAKSEKFLRPALETVMSMPVRIGDYTDFYSSREHAFNVGCMFRDPKNALMPNWLHLPVGYHGRASSIILSDCDVKRPKGQQLPPDSEVPVFGPCKQLDFELEVAFIVGKSNHLGETISTANAEEYIFGLCLFNDWSARDIQRWEYVPLGPFLSKNFASTLSPWIVTLEALEPFKTVGPVQETKILPYLEYSGEKNYDIHLQVSIKPEGSDPVVVSRSNFKYMYWNMVQQVAHHTVNGCNLKVGDLCASGTISGPTPDSYGSMLEIAWKGTKPVNMNDGTTRSFILDGDEVALTGYAEKNGVRIGFGDCKAKILPAD